MHQLLQSAPQGFHNLYGFTKKWPYRPLGLYLVNNAALVRIQNFIIISWENNTVKHKNSKNEQFRGAFKNVISEKELLNTAYLMSHARDYYNWLA